MELFLIPAIVGEVEFLRRLKIKDYWAAGTILAAAVTGGVAGALGAPGVASVWLGITGGLAGSGLVTIASRVGGDGGIG